MKNKSMKNIWLSKEEKKRKKEKVKACFYFDMCVWNIQNLQYYKKPSGKNLWATI